jgi:hypothetical protein
MTDTKTPTPTKKTPTPIDEMRYRRKMEQPAGWSMVLSCNHQITLSNQLIQNSLIDSSWAPDGTTHKTITCPKCKSARWHMPRKQPKGVKK